MQTELAPILIDGDWRQAEAPAGTFNSRNPAEGVLLSRRLSGLKLARPPGIPSSLLRFAVLHSSDNVRKYRLPLELQEINPTSSKGRRIDGRWTQADVSR